MSEQLIIGLPVLQHVKVDTRTVFEENLSQLSEPDCTTEQNEDPAKIVYVDRLMLWRLNRTEKTPEAQPLVDFKQACKEEDPFPDTSLLDPLDSDHTEKIITAVQEMESITEGAGQKSEFEGKIQELLRVSIDRFRCSQSSRPSANLSPLKVELTSNERQVKVKLPNYNKG